MSGGQLSKSLASILNKGKKMTTYTNIKNLPKKAIMKVQSGELHIFKHNEIDCVTIPFHEYCSLLEDRVRLKARKK